MEVMCVYCMLHSCSISECFLVTGVQSAAVNVVCELARKNPKNYLSLAPVFFKLMTTSTNNWMLIKIIKLVSAELCSPFFKLWICGWQCVLEAKQMKVVARTIQKVNSFSGVINLYFSFTCRVIYCIVDLIYI